MNDEIFDEYCQDQLTQLYEDEWKPRSFCKRAIKPINITEALDLMARGKLVESGYDLSFLVVIEPKTYDMADGKIFFNDFAVTFTSTNEKIRDGVARVIRDWMADNTTKMFIHVNLDDFRDRLKELSQKKDSDSQTSLFKEVLHNFLSILLINADVIHIFSYDIGTNAEDFFWTYVGTHELSIQQIKQKFDAKVDLISRGECRTRKSFISVVSGRRDLVVG